MRITLERDGRTMAIIEDNDAVSATEITELFYRAMLGIGYEATSIVWAMAASIELHEDSSPSDKD